jgi:hypothetical protein
MHLETGSIKDRNIKKPDSFSTRPAFRTKKSLKKTYI